MENRKRALRAVALGPWALAAGLVVGGFLVVGRAQAEPLDRKIPGLFGGALSMSIIAQVSDRNPDVQQLQLAARFRGLSAALAAARSQAPSPSATGAFRFEWDDELDTYVRSVQSLGPSLAERAQTLGRRTATFSMSYTHIDFTTLEGDRLDQLSSSQKPVFSEGFLARLLPGDRMRAERNALDTHLNFAFGLDLFFLTGAFGVTDSIDVSMTLSINRAHMSAVADAMIVDTIDPEHTAEGAFFTVNQKGAIIGGSGFPCGVDFRCATDRFDDSAFGTGDLFLRSKWHFYDSQFADLAAAGVLTLPTGNADDFLGFHDPTFTPWLIASKTFGPVSPHLNLGYALRTGKDVSQAQWVAGADWRALNWLTLAGDFLGFHDDKRDGINDDVIQSAVGFKLNPFGQLVVAANFQFPLNRDGLRADVIYTGQVEYTF